MYVYAFRENRPVVCACVSSCYCSSRYVLRVANRHSDKMCPLKSYRIYRMSQLPNEFVFEQSFGWSMTIFTGRECNVISSWMLRNGKPRTTGSFTRYKNTHYLLYYYRDAVVIDSYVCDGVVVVYSGGWCRGDGGSCGRWPSHDDIIYVSCV